MEKEQLIQLIEKYLNEQCTPEEKDWLEKYYDHFQQNQAAHAFGSTEQEALKQEIRQQIQAKIQPQSTLAIQRYFYLRTWLAIAASMALLVGFTYLLWLHKTTSNSLSVVATASANQIKKVRLADGSLVWLKGESKLHYPRTFRAGFREVTLEGEALFEVAKDSMQPFIVHCGPISTKVVGTSFNVRSSPGESVEIAVLTGKVSVSTAQQVPIQVLPNEKVLYQEKLKTLTKQTTSSVTKYTAGTEYAMHFTNMPMMHILSRIERKFNVVFVGPLPSFENCRLTADLTDQSLERTLEMITLSLDATYRIKNDSIYLKGTGCP